MTKKEKLEQKAIVSLASQLSRQAGAVLKKYFGGRSEIEKKEGVGNIVTRADKESEEIIVSGVRKSFPEHSILGEEGTNEDMSSNFLWSIDSLDGTLPFSNGLPWFGVSIGVLKNNRPYAAVIFIPFGFSREEELYTAVKGGGAYLNGTRIHVNSKEKLEDSIVGFDYAYTQRERRIQEILLKVAPKVRGTITLQWAVGPLCFIAAGKFDGYIHQNMQHWDIAAASLVIKEARGKVTDLLGNEIVYKQGKVFDYCASNGRIHDQLLSTIK